MNCLIILFLFFLVFPSALSERTINKEVGEKVYLLFAGPSEKWTSCTVTKVHDTDVNSPVLKPDLAGNCVYTIMEVEERHNGTWKSSFHLKSGTTVTRLEVIELILMKKPSSLEWMPEPVDDHFDYQLSRDLSVSVIVHNLRPVPILAWTLNNTTVPGLKYTTFEIFDNVQEGLSVNGTLTIVGMGEEMDEQLLSYRLWWEKMDEEGLVSRILIANNSMLLRCRNNKGPCGVTTTTTQAPPPTTRLPRPLHCNFTLTKCGGRIEYHPPRVTQEAGEPRVTQEAGEPPLLCSVVTWTIISYPELVEYVRIKLAEYRSPLEPDMVNSNHNQSYPSLPNHCMDYIIIRDVSMIPRKICLNSEDREFQFSSGNVTLELHSSNPHKFAAEYWTL